MKILAAAAPDSLARPDRPPCLPLLKSRLHQLRGEVKKATKHTEEAEGKTERACRGETQSKLTSTDLQLRGKVHM